MVLTVGLQASDRIGVYAVVEKVVLEPADAPAAEIVERMKERGVLLSTDGPFHNVLKIRPPMPFTTADGDRLVEKLLEVLGALS